MFETIRKAALSAAVAVTSLTAAPIVLQAAPMATAPSYESGVIEVRHRNWHRPHQVNRCSPQRAANKAWRMGLNRVRVTHVGARNITVRGRLRGYNVRMIFGRQPGCPVVARTR